MNVLAIIGLILGYITIGTMAGRIIYVREYNWDGNNANAALWGIWTLLLWPLILPIAIVNAPTARERMEREEADKEQLERCYRNMLEEAAKDYKGCLRDLDASDREYYKWWSQLFEESNDGSLVRERRES